ncbi:MAG: hypothetical protein WC760_11790 [Bacteroidia bacterium]|jgi:hypothetical protein
MENDIETFDVKKFEQKLAKQNSYWKSWETKRTNKWKYAFVHGSLFSVPIAVVISLIDFQPQSEGFLSKMLFYVIGFMTSGFFYGLWMYNQNEKKYQIYLSEKDEE